MLGTHGSQKRALDLLELELQMDVATMLVLGITAVSSAVTIGALNCGDISLAPTCEIN